MLANFKLKQLMGLGYSFPISTIVILTGLIINVSGKVSEGFGKIDRAEEAIVKTNDMAVSLLMMVRDFRGYILYKRENLLENVEKNWQSFQDAAKAASKVVDDPDQKERLRKMADLGEEWKVDVADEVIELVQNGKEKESAVRGLSSKGVTQVDKFDKLNREFSSAARAELKATQIEAKNTLQFLGLVAVGGAVSSVTIAAIAAYWISSKVAKRIERETEAIASCATELAVTVEQQERATAQQATAVNQTTATMDELNVSSQKSAEQAESAAERARQALTLADGGTEAVGHTLEEMANLKERVGAIADQILHLSKQTNQIADISSLVSDLASQTNMLALNATVEAVRAGEHGKGFAVVASEIRKLADESKKSAAKINLLVAEIQGAIDSTVTVTEQGTQTVSESVQVARSTSSAFAGVKEAIDNLVLNNQSISLNVNQQAIAVHQVLEAMNAINGAARDTSGGISQVRLGIEKLNNTAQNLKAVV